MGVEFPAINLLVKCVAASQSGSGGGLMSGGHWKPPLSALLVHLSSLALPFITLAKTNKWALYICTQVMKGYFILLFFDYLSSERSNVTDVTW